MKFFQNGLPSALNGSGDLTLLDLEKALTAGDITGRETTDLEQAGTISGLKYESLDRNVKNLQNKLEDRKFWFKVPKFDIFNTVHEFNQLAKYGTRRSNATAEGEVPKNNDPLYVRRAEKAKFIGETRSVNDVSLRMRTSYGNEGSGGLIEREVQNGILSLTETLDYMAFNSNSDIVPLEFDGLKSLHADLKYWTTLDQYQQSSNVIDLRGTVLNEDAISDAANAIVQDGLGTMRNAMFWSTPQVMTDFTKNFATNNTKYIIPNTPSQTAGNAGQLVPGSYTQLGYVPFEYDIFVARKKPKFANQAEDNSDAPAAPVTPASAAVADALSQFVNFDGDYFYGVTAINRFGESAMLPLNVSLLGVASTQSVNLTFAAGASIANREDATGFVIYRSERNPATPLNSTPLYPIIEVSTAQLATGYDGAPAGSVRDRNRTIPNCEDGFVMQFDDQVIEFGELDKMKKVVLPQSNFLGQVFVLIQYGMMMMYAPKRVVKIQNIGRI